MLLWLFIASYSLIGLYFWRYWYGYFVYDEIAKEGFVRQKGGYDPSGDYCQTDAIVKPSRGFAFTFSLTGAMIWIPVCLILLGKFAYDRIPHNTKVTRLFQSSTEREAKRKILEYENETRAKEVGLGGQ